VANYKQITNNDRNSFPRHNPGMPAYPRRWFAFRLRTLFVVAAVLAVPCVWVARPSLKARFLWIKSGHSRFYVRAVLGAPDDTSQQVGVNGQQPLFGLASRLKCGRIMALATLSSRTTAVRPQTNGE
jgi:hypothetical protein